MLYLLNKYNIDGVAQHNRALKVGFTLNETCPSQLLYRIDGFR